MIATIPISRRRERPSMLAYESYQAGYDSSMSSGYKNHNYGHFGHSFCHSRQGSISGSPTYTPPNNILILGATGVIGTYITRAIVDAHSQGHFGKISIYTSEKTVFEKVQEIAGLEAWAVEVMVGSLHDEGRFKDACRGVDTVVSCLGRSAIPQQIPLISWAEEAGVTRFFASEYGTDIEYFPESMHEPPHQIKLEVRAHLRKMSRLEHTFIVTGPYSDLFFGALPEWPKAGGFDVQTTTAHMLGDGDAPISFTAMNDVGKFVVAALINHVVSRNATLNVHSFTATPNEIYQEYQKQTQKKWETHYLDLNELKQWEKDAYHVYPPLATILTLRRIWTEGGTLHKFYDDSLLGFVETETLEDQVRLNIAKQTGQVASGLGLMNTLSAV